MKRIYPALTEELKPYCVPHENLAYRVVDGMVVAPFLFEKTIPLLGSPPPELYMLDYASAIETLYIRIPEVGIVAFKVDGMMMNLGMQTGPVNQIIVWHAPLNLTSPELPEGASIYLRLNGALNLRRSIVDVDAYIVSHKGLAGEPELLGYDLILYEAEKPEVAQAA
jgi:hypothetical protein